MTYEVSDEGMRFNDGSLQSTAVPASNQVRQTVSRGVTDANGYANMFSAGSGLALNLAATAKPMKINFAAGITDFSSLLSADATGAVSGLPANMLSYIAADYATNTSVNWSSTKAPPQYGYAYNRTAQSILHFGGSAGSTTFLDDFGNTWSAGGGAKVQTNQTKFGGTALGGGGASNAMNGSSDHIKTTSIKTLGNGSWSLRCWFYSTSIAAIQTLLNGAFGVGTTYGIHVRLQTTGKMIYSMSSNGSSDDIASVVSGSTTITTNAWHFFEITYDAVAGKYIAYVDGAQDLSVTSAAKICPFVEFLLGALTTPQQFWVGYIDEFEFLPYCDHPAGTTYAVPTSAPDVTAAGYASDFFSIPDMTMYRISGASSVAGNNPAMTAVNRVYVGECVTGSSTVTSMVNYALNGRYDSGYTNPVPSAATVVSRNHNIGVVPDVRDVWFRCLNAEQGYSVGDVIRGATQPSGGVTPPHQFPTPATPITVGFTTGATAAMSTIHKTAGSWVNLTTANWAYRITAWRGW